MVAQVREADETLAGYVAFQMPTDKINAIVQAASASKVDTGSSSERDTRKS